jgi:hypothetical protein
MPKLLPQESARSPIFFWSAFIIVFGVILITAQMVVDAALQFVAVQNGPHARSISSSSYMLGLIVLVIGVIFMAFASVLFRPLPTSGDRQATGVDKAPDLRAPEAAAPTKSVETGGPVSEPASPN